MRRFNSFVRAVAASPQLALSAIAAGLAILAAALLWPGVPALTAMALVTLGATSATLSRFRGRPALLPVIVAHAAVYGSLYILFVGASLHSATLLDITRTSLVTLIDLLLSVVPLALATEMMWCAVRTGHSAE